MLIKKKWNLKSVMLLYSGVIFTNILVFGSHAKLQVLGCLKILPVADMKSPNVFNSSFMPSGGRG